MTLAGVTLINQYMVLSYLGQGSSGRVYLCMDIHDSRLYAVKVQCHIIIQMLQLNLAAVFLAEKCTECDSIHSCSCRQWQPASRKSRLATLNPEPKTATQVLVKGELAERHSRHAARAANALSDLHSEIAVMRALRHRNIVTLLEVCHH